MYVQHNIEARSRKHYCCGKEVNVKYFCVCVSVSVSVCECECECV